MTATLPMASLRLHSQTERMSERVKASQNELDRLGGLSKDIEHFRKLKRGVHRLNRFTLRLTGDIAEHPGLSRQWQTLCEAGVPNYFGPQRFGREGRNLIMARSAFARGWRKRDDPHGMQLSAARSFLFNEVLAARLRTDCWRTPRDGDVLALAGSASRFVTETVDATLLDRARRGDVAPTGPLWGKGRQESGAEVAHCGHERIDDWAAIGRTLDHQDIFVLFFAHRFQRSQRRRTWQVRLAAR